MKHLCDSYTSPLQISYSDLVEWIAQNELEETLPLNQMTFPFEFTKVEKCHSATWQLEMAQLEHKDTYKQMHQNIIFNFNTRARAN